MGVVKRERRHIRERKKEWEPKLSAKGVASLPTDRDAFAQLVFSQPEYKSRKVRDLESPQRFGM